MPFIKRNGHYETMKDAILGLAQCTETDLLDPVLEDPRCIENMYKAAVYIGQAIKNNVDITVIGDYDSDGLNASAILVKLFRFFGKEVSVIIPRRISDGYGLSMKHIENIKPGLVITVDNGIAALEAMAALKKRGGYYTIVMDHHLPGEVLPDADLIIDPHVHPDKNGFRFYCGAGLAYQLSRLLLESTKREDAQKLKDELLVHAAIATVTDSMPLVGSNRRILMDGLVVMNDYQERLSPGMRELLAVAPEGPIDEKTIGFTFGPIINAPARLYDAGGASTVKALTCTDGAEMAGYMEHMVKINEDRKTIVNAVYANVKAHLDSDPAIVERRPIVVYQPNIPEGIIGIIAGKLSEAYMSEVVVFSNSQMEPGILKGSGRAGANGTMLPILERVRSHCVACGGHVGAMGISIREEDLNKISTMMYEAFPHGKADRVLVYDLPLVESYVQQAFKDQAMFGPLGEGCPKPVVYLRGAHAVVVGDSYYRYLGKDQSILKVFCKGYDCFGTGLAKKFQDLGCPPVIDVIGRLSANTFRGQTTVQIDIIDFCVSKVQAAQDAVAV